MKKPPAKTTGQPEPATYEIRLKGHLDMRWREQLGVAHLAHENDGTTILSGIEADQSVLHGLMQRIRDLGLTLISLNRIDSTAGPDQPADSITPSK